MITYSTCSPLIPAASSAALIAAVPSSPAVMPAKAPESLPMGVRWPETMTEPGMESPPGRWGARRRAGTAVTTGGDRDARCASSQRVPDALGFRTYPRPRAVAQGSRRRSEWSRIGSAREFRDPGHERGPLVAQRLVAHEEP